MCFQEIKKEFFDLQFLKNICPPTLNSFALLPSISASGGILIACKGSVFAGNMVFSNEFAVSMEFLSLHNETKWLLTCVYGPCTAEGKLNFINWLKNIQMPEDLDWLLLGDFNLIRRSEDRNKPGGNLTEMFLFNSSISKLGLIEIPLQEREFT